MFCLFLNNKYKLIIAMTTKNRARINRKAALFSVCTALGLTILKSIVAFVSGSLAVFASALDSLFDLFVSGTSFWAVKKSEAHPTQNFQYGFGKLEGIMGLFQSLVIISSGLLLAFLGIKRVLYGGEITHYLESTIVMILSLIVTIWLVRFLQAQAKISQSLILEADAVHYKSDVLSNIAVLISIVLIYFTGKIQLDGAVSFIIALFVIISGIEIAQKSIFLLLDHKVSSEMYNAIKKILNKAKKKAKITGYHYLRTRKSGSKVFVDVHLVFTNKTLLRDAHATSDAIETQIQSIIGNGEILVHLDPVDDS